MNFKKLVFIFAVFTPLRSLSYLNSPKQYSHFRFNKELKSKYVLLYNIETDSIVYEKNAEERCYPASLTKIATFNSCIDIEKLSDNGKKSTDKNQEQDSKDEKILIEKNVIDSLNGTGSSLAGLVPGSYYSMDELLNLMMIKSGNDAALSLAHKMGPGVDNFMNFMNEKIKEIGCLNTHFVNPHGLHDDDHYTTCYDLLKIIKYAMKNDRFREIVKTKSLNIDGKTVYNTNELLIPESRYYYDKCYGIKTGRHTEAGYCLASIAGDGSTNYICLCLGAPMYDENNKKIEDNSAMLDSISLYKWAFDNFKLINSLTVKFPICLSSKFDIPIELYIDSYNLLIPKRSNAYNIRYNIDIPRRIDTPVNSGTTLGDISFYCNGNLLASREVKSKKSVKLNFFNKFKFILKNVFR